MTAYPITAYSIINALGETVADVAASLRAGQTGLRDSPFATPFPVTCGPVAKVLPELPSALQAYDTRQARLCAALAAGVAAPVAAACTRWGADRVGVILGTSTGGIAATEVAYAHSLEDGAVPDDFDLWRHHSMDATLHVARTCTGAAGPGWIVSTACSSSGKVFGSARRMLALGLVDAVLVGGVDTLCEMTIRGFHALDVLSETPCRPFSSRRAGINLGEGGALLLLERDGEGSGRLLGVGESSDAHHMSAPHPEGAGAVAAIEAALRDAGLGAADVGHVNAHATGTPLNDAAESRAIASTLGGDVPVVATKGYTGHLLGAAAATEAVFTLLALESGRLPASLGCDPLDVTLGIDVVQSERASMRPVGLSNSFAFGGSNVAVILGGPG